MTGWIKIDRDITKHWLWTDPIKFKWWIDMLITVNFKDNKVLIGNTLIECKRGQCVMSLKSWGDRWGVDKDKVRNFFVLLAKDGIILHENISKSTRITICNYDTYQHSLHDGQTITNQSSNDYQTTIKTIEESKEIKEGKKKKEVGGATFIPPTLQEVVDYFKENQYKESVGETAYKYYQTLRWVDSKGKPVKNWKAKMISVWFKDENKKPLIEDNTYTKIAGGGIYNVLDPTKKYD